MSLIKSMGVKVKSASFEIDISLWIVGSVVWLFTKPDSEMKKVEGMKLYCIGFVYSADIFAIKVPIMGISTAIVISPLT